MMNENYWDVWDSNGGISDQFDTYKGALEYAKGLVGNAIITADVVFHKKVATVGQGEIVVTKVK